MNLSPEWLLSTLLFLPVLWGLPLLVFPDGSERAMKWYALLGTVLACLVSVAVLGEFEPRAVEAAASYQGLQLYFAHPWIASWNINYALGIDGLNLPLILLTTAIFVLAAICSWNVTKYLRGYLFLLLLLETGVLGVFLAMDFFLFYVFWEVMLLPMYFLIGIWGGSRREYAAIKFFLFTLFGGVLLLVGMLMAYFHAGHSFDLVFLAQVGQGAVETLPDVGFSPQVQVIAFVLLFIGFAIKLPCIPFHTWLPDAHVEAPTPISMILAGVLLKLGGYGILRVAMPLFPYGAQQCAYLIVLLGVVSIIYGALAAMAQTDFKRLVAYSSVSHMGYVLLGLGVWKVHEITGAAVGRDYWSMGINAALFQMVGHGITSAGMFFAVGVLYDRVAHRDLDRFGGIAGRLPRYSGFAMGLFFAGLGLPGLCGFIGEVFAVLSSWNYHPVFAVIAASGLFLTAGYILWTIQRVYLGPEYLGPRPEGLTPLAPREYFVGYVLMIWAIVLGIFPQLVFRLTEDSVDRLTAGMDRGYQVAVQSDSEALVTLPLPTQPVTPPAVVE